jgi:hypothetical protein
LWEENRAREAAPWNGKTRVRGVEFGTSPMPLGLDHARKLRSLFDTPVLTSIPGDSRMETRYDMFLHPAPQHWTQIKDVLRFDGNLVVRGDGNEKIQLARGNRRL